MIPKVLSQWWRGGCGIALMTRPRFRIYRGVSVQFWQIAWLRIYMERAK